MSAIPTPSAPNPQADEASAANSPAVDSIQFVNWFRTVAPYMHAFHGKTFVIGFCGELVQAGKLAELVYDIALLHAMDIRIVVVHGSRPQINEQLKLRGIQAQYVQGMRITDPGTLECAKEAAGELRFDIESEFSMGLPNTPMAHADIHVVSGNFITARPVGIVGGVDFRHTGVVRKVAVNKIHSALQEDNIVLLSPFGFSPTGEGFNLAMEDVATSTAIALQAEKLIFITELPRLLDADGEVITELTADDADQIVKANTINTADGFYLNYAIKACRNGVNRAHLIPFSEEGSLLVELFTHEGTGTMLVNEELEALREATVDDVGSIVDLIAPLEAGGILVARGHDVIEREIETFSLLEHDSVVFGCASLRAWPEVKTGEMACLVVEHSRQGTGYGDQLLKRIEQRAKAGGLKKIFVLTTRSMHWFQRRGFRIGDINDLPPARQKSYNTQRKSQILIKDI
ncbi:MAG: amino-acid N-acetyltransferase [Burkholderiaceae bacterium]|nr:MAG: amino-acid N-acetyltransferase [Burkholderiaceae bacterium]